MCTCLGSAACVVKGAARACSGTEAPPDTLMARCLSADPMRQARRARDRARLQILQSLERGSRSSRRSTTHPEQTLADVAARRSWTVDARRFLLLP